MRLNLIQALRGFAAYLVLFFHLRGLELASADELNTEAFALVGGVFASGWSGVDLFFVISGFIMVYVTFSRPEGASTVKDFLLARAFRIYPPWWLFAGLMALYYVLQFGVPWDPEEMARLNNTGLNHVARSFLLAPQPNLPLLEVGWTLVHEIWFYLVFAVILFLPRKVMPFALLVWALGVTGGALAGYASSHAANYLQLATSPLTLEFIAGGLTAWVILKSDKAFMPIACLVLGAVSMLVAAWVHPRPDAFTLEWGRVLVFTLPCILMVYGAAGLKDSVKGSAARWMGRLGDWSFALYLSHTFVLVAIRRFGQIFADRVEPMAGMPAGTLDFLRLGAPGIADNAFFLVVCPIAATIVAALTYYLFEQPLLRFLTKLFRKPQTDKEKARLNETVAP